MHFCTNYCKYIIFPSFWIYRYSIEEALSNALINCSTLLSFDFELMSIWFCGIWNFAIVLLSYKNCFMIYVNGCWYREYLDNKILNKKREKRYIYIQTRKKSTILNSMFSRIIVNQGYWKQTKKQVFRII